MALSKLSRSVAGKVVIVTGAASGMGRATARLFADEGASVALIDVNEGPLQAVLGEIRDAGYNAEAWTLDLLDSGRPIRFVGSRSNVRTFERSNARHVRTFETFEMFERQRT